MIKQTPFLVNQDYHLHSQLSTCSADPAQTTEQILQYAIDNGLTELCLTDHYWDEDVPGASDWYKPQNTSHQLQALPLPQSEKVRFRFGCETELDMHCRLGISEKKMELFDFIIIPTTHLHMAGFTIDGDADEAARADAWVNRLDYVLHQDLPFEKIGIAHLTARLMGGKGTPDPVTGKKVFPRDYLKILSFISDETMRELFSLAAKRGVGIELNIPQGLFNLPEWRIQDTMRPYRIAKKCGCKFYFGSDAHHPDKFDCICRHFQRLADYLELTESDRFNIPG